MKPLGLWTLPNAITWYRVVAAVPIIFLLVNGSNAALWAALGLMAVAEISDGVDGWVARRYGQVSAVGKILDPMADSLYRVSVFTAFAANRWMPVWMFLIMLWRDVSVSYLRVVAEQRIGTLAARQSGKLKAVSQGVAQILVVAGYAWWGTELPSEMHKLLWAVLFVATLVTGWSLFDYALSVYRGLKAGGRQPPI
ncbi:MAG: CDP-diacylglycerol--glycerol-3-phosphate 3-phosphatidyltransferase [Hyphomicrobium sp.]|nr:CDP-diacylglycerol--glycerol-3-phosphate 3-phosphatidyltransferase [Hyphomicrobium sp.]